MSFFPSLKCLSLFPSTHFLSVEFKSKSIKIFWITGFLSIVFSGLMGISASFAQENKYIVETIILPDGKIIEATVYPSPPQPPHGIERT